MEYFPRITQICIHFFKKIKLNTKKFMPFSKFIRENLRNLWEFIIWFKTKKTAEAAFKKLI